MNNLIDISVGNAYAAVGHVMRRPADRRFSTLRQHKLVHSGILTTLLLAANQSKKSISKLKVFVYSTSSKTFE